MLIESYTHPLTVSDYWDYQRRLAILQATERAFYRLRQESCEESKVTLRPPAFQSKKVVAK